MSGPRTRGPVCEKHARQSSLDLVQSNRIQSGFLFFRPVQPRSVSFQSSFRPVRTGSGDFTAYCPFSHQLLPPATSLATFLAKKKKKNRKKKKEEV